MTEPGLTAAVITISDSVAAGAAVDRSGPTAVIALQALGFTVTPIVVVPDSASLIKAALVAAADDADVDVVLTTGGTGLTPRDVTPAATAGLLDRPAPGLADLVRRAGADRVPTAALSCGVAGLRGGTVIVNLPGSVGGVGDGMAALAPVLAHAVGQARGTQLAHAAPMQLAIPNPIPSVGRVALVSILDEPLDVGRAVAAVTSPEAGGLGIFAGVVRDHDHGQAVTALTYEAHPSAVDALRSVCARAAARPGVTAVAAEHRIGNLVVGDLAVVVAVGAPHRAEALEACRWLIDTLKAEVPIWKKQTYTDGSDDWVGSPQPS